MQPSKDRTILKTPFFSEPNNNNEANANFENSHHIDDDDDVLGPKHKNRKEKTEITTKIAVQKRCFADPEKRRKMTDIVLFCFFLIYVFGVFIWLGLLWNYHSNNTDANLSPISGALSYIAFNLDSHPILDIKIQDNNLPCPENYHMKVLGIWPGTFDGCLCPSGLKRGSCDKSGDNARDTDCDDISLTNPINMLDWGEEKWCVLRAKPGSEYKKSVTCPEGFRKCSPGICVLQSLSCPVTNIRKEEGSFVVENVEGKPPVIDITITPNNISCFGVESFANGSTSPYILIHEDEYGCSRYGLDDGNSFFLDSQKQKELFYQNDFPLTVLDLIDYRKVYDKTDAVLSYRKRLNMAEKDFCLNLDTEILKKASETMDDMQNYMHGTLVAGSLLNFLLCCWFISWIIPVVFCCTSFEKIRSKQNVNTFLGVSLGCGLIRTIDIIVMFGGMIYYRKKMVDIKEYFVETDGCFLDEKSESVMNDYQALGDEVSWTLLKYSIILFVMSTVTIFPSFYLYHRSTKRTIEIENSET